MTVAPIERGLAPAAPPQQAPPVVGALVEWAQSARAAHSIAVSLVDTSFVPAGFRGKANEATAAILAGTEVGLSPMAALRAFDVIQGQAAPRAITLRAIVQSRGHEVWVEEATSTRAVVRGRRAGSQRTEVSTWTMDRARELGLAGKDNWRKQPQAMLVARATSEVCRLIAADAILGISAYSVEELVDAPGDTAEAAPAPRTATLRRKTSVRAPAERVALPAPAEADVPPEPPLEEPAPPQQQDDKPTQAQLRKMHAQLGDLGYGSSDRLGRLAVVSRFAGRPVESSADLTRAEASAVVEGLGQLLDEPDPQGTLLALLDGDGNADSDGDEGGVSS